LYFVENLNQSEFDNFLFALNIMVLLLIQFLRMI